MIKKCMQKYRRLYHNDNASMLQLMVCKIIYGFSLGIRELPAAFKQKRHNVKELSS